MSSRPFCRLLSVVGAAAVFFFCLEPGLSAPILAVGLGSIVPFDETLDGGGSFVHVAMTQECIGIEGAQLPTQGEVDADDAQSDPEGAPCASRRQEADSGCRVDMDLGDPSSFFWIDPSGDVKIGPSVMTALPFNGEQDWRPSAFDWVPRGEQNCPATVRLSPLPGMAGAAIREARLNPVVPEPGSASLTLLGLLAVGFLKGRGLRRG